MTWHLEHAVASVPAFSVASQQAILLLDAPAPLWRQPTSGQGVLWSLLDCLSQAGNSLCRGLCVQGWFNQVLASYGPANKPCASVLSCGDPPY